MRFIEGIKQGRLKMQEEEVADRARIARVKARVILGNTSRQNIKENKEQIIKRAMLTARIGTA